jgi:hypothetical protein
MRVIVVATVIACTGCETQIHRSTLPPYVRELRAAPGGIEMIQCEMVYTKKEEWEYRFWDGGWGKEIETRLDHGACWRTLVPTEVAP